MRTRTSISLERSQLRALQARAQGVSVAEVMRQIVADYLSAEQPPISVPSSVFEGIVGIGSSGRVDVADRHDALLGEALRKEHDP
jgi:hypothetical protein